MSSGQGPVPAWHRVDQIGSLVRPSELVTAFAKFDRGEIDEATLTAAQDQAIRAILKKQEDMRFPILVDGEFRRHGFQDSFGQAVSGFEARKSDAQRSAEERARVGRVETGIDAPGRPISTRQPAVERLQLTRNVPLEEFIFARDAASSPVKVALIGPDRVAQRFRWEESLSVYDGLDDFVNHVVEIQRDMITALGDAGCPYVQIDAPGYTAFVDEPSMGRMRARGEDPVRNLERSIAADNALIANIPGITFGIHICKGNSRTTDPKTGKVLPQWHREGTYDAIAERLFSELDHERFLLEYDDERSGGFEPLRFIPKGRIAVLGLVSTKTEEIESVDLLKRRIEEASKYLSVEQLAISPQCGFASGIGGVTVSQDQQWRKLEALIETAQQVWG
jgi:5-methyltetrahydropteroyltriglutamate--homocysteine methyltransferase